MLKLLVSAAALTVFMLSGPEAVVVRVDGEVRVERAAGEVARAAAGTALSAGDRLVPASGARAVLLYRTGRKEVATSAVTVAAPAAAERAGAFDRAVATLDDVAAANARRDPNRQGMIRPVPGTPAPIAPRNGLAVLSDRPTFSWFGVEGATGYTVQLLKEGGPPLRYETGGDTVWTPPADSPALERGAAYTWTVAPAGGRVARPVRFRVVSQAERAALESSLSALARLGFEPEGDGAFLTALAYRDAGLMYEADRLLDALDAERAAGGRPYHLLRAEVHDALGELDEAAAAFARADEETAGR